MILLLPARVGWRTARLVGFRRLALVAAGVGVGLLVAPQTGAELRDRIRREWEKRQAATEPLLPIESEGPVQPEQPGTLPPA